MSRLEILTFNWHEGYLCLLAKTGHRFTVVDKNKGGRAGWILETRPIPSNIHLLPIGSEEAAIDLARRNKFDLALCHNLSDLSILSRIPIPKILVFHNRISTELELFRIGGQPVPTKNAYIAQFRSLFDERTSAVFISETKRVDAGSIEGTVIPPGIDLSEYGGYEGSKQKVLRVGNFFTGRDVMLGQSHAQAILRDLPVSVLGINPEIPGARLSKSWDELKDNFRSHRVYLNTTVYPYEDGYNLALLEAMATGMPVVGTMNKTSPIENGINGFVSDNWDALHDALRTLLHDPSLAKQLGKKARETVAEKFPIDRYLTAWNNAFEDATNGTATKAAAPSCVDWSPALNELRPLLDRDEWAKARPLLERVIKKAPNFAQAWKSLGIVYNHLGRVPEATRAFWAAARLDPADQEAMDLHQETLASSLTAHPENNPEAWVLYPLCSGRGIDVGCGGSKTHPSAIGVDIVPAGSVYPSAEVDKVKSVADICAPGDDMHMFRDGELDYVVSRHNLEHYQDPIKTLEEWHRVLEPGGLLGLVLPDDRQADTIHLDPTHKHVFTPDSFHRLMSYFGGFDILYTGTCLLNWSFTVVLQKHDGPNGLFDYGNAVRKATAHRCRIEAIRREKRGETRAALECWREVEALDPGAARDVKRRARAMNPLDRPQQEEMRERNRRQGNTFKHANLDSGATDVIRPGKDLHSAWPLVEGTAPAIRRRILLSYCANPMTTGTYIERALRRRHDVLTWGPCIDDTIMKRWNMEELRDRVRPTDLACDTWDVAQALRQQAGGWDPDLFLWVESGVNYRIEGLERLNCPKVCYLIDTHIDLPNDRRVDSHIGLARAFDVAFLAQRSYLEKFHDAGINAYWLPLACDPEIHRDHNIERVHSIGFVGSLNQQRRLELLEDLRSRYAVLTKRCFLEDMSHVFSQCKIVFNNAVNNDLNMRVFEAMSSGALLLTDPATGSGLEEFFADGEHLAVYREDDELVDMAEKWLTDEKERNKVACAGKKMVLAHHTYEHRIAFLEQVLFEPSAVNRRRLSLSSLVTDSIGRRLQARALMTSRSGDTFHGPGAARTSPEIESKLGRGRIMLSAGKWDQASASFKKWAAEDPDDPYALIGLGSLALARSDWNAAVNEYQAALTLCPDQPKALCGLGLALQYAGREKEAREVLKQILEAAPAQLETLYAQVHSARKLR